MYIDTIVLFPLLPVQNPQKYTPQCKKHNPKNTKTPLIRTTLLRPAVHLHPTRRRRIPRRRLEPRPLSWRRSRRISIRRSDRPSHSSRLHQRLRALVPTSDQPPDDKDEDDRADDGDYDSDDDSDTDAACCFVVFVVVVPCAAVDTEGGHFVLVLREGWVDVGIEGCVS